MLLIELGGGYIMKYTLKNNNTYLLFTFSGEYDFYKSVELINSIKLECINKNILKVLADSRQVEKNGLSNLNRFNMGVEIGKVLNSKIQLAILDNEKDINHLVEISANNRSSYVKTSPDRKELLKWLS